MVIRSGITEEREYPTAILSALERASGAPRWLCEWVWEESLEDRRQALELLRNLAPFPPTRQAADSVLAALVTPLRLARARGSERAREDLRSGRFIRLGVGLLRAPDSFCPACRIRIPCVPERSDGCPTCGTPVFHMKTTGCCPERDTHAFVEGYRAEVNAFLRERFPEFSWKDVGLRD